MTPDEAAALIQRVEDEERRLRLPRFDNDDAWLLGTLLVGLGTLTLGSRVIGTCPAVALDAALWGIGTL
ncbi:hypothetical protein ACFVXQ_19885, partial [Kitasatospora sp. NPDC058263]